MSQRQSLFDYRSKDSIESKGMTCFGPIWYWAVLNEKGNLRILNSSKIKQLQQHLVPRIFFSMQLVERKISTQLTFFRQDILKLRSRLPDNQLIQAPVQCCISTFKVTKNNAQNHECSRIIELQTVRPCESILNQHNQSLPQCSFAISVCELRFERVSCLMNFQGGKQIPFSSFNSDTLNLKPFFNSSAIWLLSLWSFAAIGWSNALN